MFTKLLMLLAIIVYTAPCSTKEKQPTTIYCHGLGGSKHEVHGLVEEKVIHRPARGIQCKNERDSCLGHGRNIDMLDEEINPDREHIYYGVSCGGVVIINRLAQHNSEQAKALIIDATPADMVNLAEEIQYKIGVWMLWTRAQHEWAIGKIFPEYPQGSTPPVQAIANIENKQLPVFIVHSHNDPVVNIRSAWENYKAFKQAGFEHVYICELEQGGHMNNAYGPDSTIYKQAINSFYKKYGLRYSEKYATLSDEELEQFQPSVEEIDKKLSNNLEKLRRQGFVNLGVYATYKTIKSFFGEQ